METNEIRLEAQDLNQQAALLIETGNFEAAKEKIEKAIETDPMCVESYRNYGDLMMGMRQYTDAKNYYKKALLIEKQGVFYFLYGNACFMNEEVHEGLENYNLALSNGFDNEEMQFFMGLAYEHLNDDKMALRYFKKACMKNPSRSDYQVKKISVMLRIGIVDQAEMATDELLQNAPELFDGYHIKTRILLYNKKYDEAVEFSKMASERFPEDIDLMFDYVQSVVSSGDVEKALSLVEIAKQMKYFEGGKAKFLHLEAQIVAENGDIEKAISLCEECISLEQEGQYFGEVRFMLLNLLLVNKEFESAYKQADAIVGMNRKDLYYHAALYYKPFSLKQLGKMEEAVKLYKEINSMYRLHTLNNPSAIDVYLYRVMCLKDLEMYDRALEILEFIEGITNEIAEVYTLRAEIYRHLGKEVQADEEMKKAYNLKPELKTLDSKAGE